MTKAELLQTAKPILFNTDMVRAILDGRKTVTRRVVKPKPIFNRPFWRFGDTMWSCGIKSIIPVPGHSLYNRMPFKPGDILYVRETWFYESYMEDMTDREPDLPSGRYSTRYVYKASNPNYPVDVGVNAYGWRPSIHMPKESARIFLRVKDVRMERLQEINADGIRNEGLTSMAVHVADMEIAQAEFALLWNGTIKKSDLDRYGWFANPWVWVIEFERVEAHNGT